MKQAKKRDQEIFDRLVSRRMADRPAREGVAGRPAVLCLYSDVGISFWAGTRVGEGLGGVSLPQPMLEKCLGLSCSRLLWWCPCPSLWRLWSLLARSIQALWSVWSELPRF
jgi:hypothetical protein